MMNTLRNNNAYEDEFGKHHNKYKYTAHIDSIPNIHRHIMHQRKQDMGVLIMNLIYKI